MQPVADVRQRFRLGRKARRGTPSGANGERAAVSGDLELFGLAELVQTLALAMKTACLSVCHGNRQGRIWFERGATRHAVTDGSYGEAAFYEMMRWTAGRFTIEHGIESEERTLREDAQYLLMEGSRRIDESEHGGVRDELPDPEGAAGSVVLTQQMRAELEDLFADLTTAQAESPQNRAARGTPGRPVDGGRAKAETSDDGPAAAKEPKRKLPAEVLALHRDLLGAVVS
jgi:hypothetical protein